MIQGQIKGTMQSFRFKHVKLFTRSSDMEAVTSCFIINSSIHTGADGYTYVNRTIGGGGGASISWNPHDGRHIKTFGTCCFRAAILYVGSAWKCITRREVSTGMGSVNSALIL
jgi:hypothetical protein